MSISNLEHTLNFMMGSFKIYRVSSLCVHHQVYYIGNIAQLQTTTPLIMYFIYLWTLFYFNVHICNNLQYNTWFCNKIIYETLNILEFKLKS